MKKTKTLVVLFLTLAMAAAMTVSLTACGTGELVKISLDTSGVSTEFAAGDVFSNAGLKITAEYNDGSTKDIATTDCTISIPDMTAAGSKTVTVTYEGVSATYTVTVGAKEPDWVKPDGTEYKFEGEDSRVKLIGGELGPLGTAKETNLGATETYVSNFNANLGAKIAYSIFAAEETDATLVVSVCKRGSASVFTNVVATFVGDEMIDAPDGIVPATGNGEKDWVTFVDVSLGTVHLAQGPNEITFSIMDADASLGYNFNYMSLYADSVELGWHVPEGEAYYFEAEDAFSNGWGEVVDGKFDGFVIDRTVTAAHGGAVVRGLGDNADKDYYFSFDVNAEEAADFSLYLAAGIGGTLDVDQSFVFSLDGNKVPTGKSLTGNWEEYREYELFEGNLTAGPHTLRFDVKTGCLANFDAIKLVSTTTISVPEPANVYQFEAEKAESNSWNDGTDWLWRSPSDTAVGGMYVSHVENAATDHPGEAWISFTFTADKASAAKFYFGFALDGSVPAGAFTISLDDEPLTLSLPTITGSGWGTYITSEVCAFDLPADTHTLKIVFNAGARGDFDYFRLATDATITADYAAA